MTLEQASETALIAAETGDLNALERALRARAKALVQLKRSPPSEDLAARMEGALRTGQSIEQALCALKRRIGFESVRLAQLESGLSTGLGFSRRPHISFRG